MKAHYLQQVSFEGLGSIESFLRAAGYKITKTQFFKSETLPKPDEIDLLIVMPTLRGKTKRHSHFIQRGPEGNSQQMQIRIEMNLEGRFNPGF